MSFHLYRINELYSNADGTVQFIELAVGNDNGESFWQGQTLTVTQGSTSHSFIFPSNLPSLSTANTTVLVATQGFKDLGLVTPDFVVPAGFLFTNGGTVNFANVDAVSYASLPADGNHSIDRNGALEINSPRNFAGATASLPASGALILGSGGDDSLMTTAGNDDIDGSLGIDTVVFNGLRNNYQISQTANGYLVKDNVGTDGSDTLMNVERLQFSDKKLALDLSPEGHAGQALEFIGTLASDKVADPGTVGLILGFFDHGFGMHDLFQVAFNVGLVRQLAGSDSNTDLARLAYRNIIGTEPDAATVLFLASFMQGNGGTMSQADFLTTVAGLEVNQNHVNLVGLAQTGVEYLTA